MPPEPNENTVDNALERLNKALDELNQAVDVMQEKNGQFANADAEIQRMADDRSKLARELDGVEAKVLRLSDTNREVSRRLVGAMEVVREVLNKQSL